MSAHNFTVGELLDFIEKYNIPRESKVFYQRIEDVYFEKHNWTTVKKEGYNYLQHGKKWNDDIDSGKYLDKESYPDMKEEMLVKFTEGQLEELKEKYIPVFSPVKYKDDNNLYLDAHY